MPQLELNDVERLIRLVATAGDPTIDIPIHERKRTLVAGVCEMVQADVWMWNTCVANPDKAGDVMATCIMDDGWQDDAERLRFLQLLVDPHVGHALQSRVMEALAGETPVTYNRQEFILPEVASWALPAWEKVGLSDSLLAVYPLGGMAYSGVGLHRRGVKPPFSDRDRMIVHTAFRQVDWLHRHGSDVPAASKVLELSPRQREVLMYLLGADTQRQIAMKLGLSEHTVGDYVKQIYRRFEVNSRPELLTHFMSGGQA